MCFSKLRKSVKKLKAKSEEGHKWSLLLDRTRHVSLLNGCTRGSGEGSVTNVVEFTLRLNGQRESPVHHQLISTAGYLEVDDRN